MTTEVWEVIQWWRDYEDFSSFPYPGGASEQPQYVLQAIRACREERARVELSRLPKVPEVKRGR